MYIVGDGSLIAGQMGARFYENACPNWDLCCKTHELRVSVKMSELGLLLGDVRLARLYRGFCLGGSISQLPLTPNA
jgi:hypothetical protein